MSLIEKPQANSKWDRINTIYKILSISHNGISIGELSLKMGVSSKTIQRDLYEVLGEYGAVKSGRMWKLDKKQSNDNLNPQERIILGILDEMAKNGGSSFYGKAHALLKQVSQQLEHPIFTNVDSESLEESHIELFTLLEKAIKHKVEVNFSYKKHTFYVKPLKLAFFDGFWYVLALDSKDKDKFKKFHLKSLSHLLLSENDFSVPSPIEGRLKQANSIWFDLDESLFDVHLLVNKEIAEYSRKAPPEMVSGSAIL